MDDRMITVCKLPADGSLQAITEEIPDKLEVLQQWVGGHIEIVTLSESFDGRRLVMIVNECGLINGLPLNPIASVVYYYFLGAETLIVGNAIICTADEEGELQDISPFTAVHLFMMISKGMPEGIEKQMQIQWRDHMTKEDLNRQFGDGRQKPITPLDLLAAAHLIRENCDDCRECIFHADIIDGCILFELFPCRWDLSIAEHKAADWIDKQLFQGRGLYTDTDTMEGSHDQRGS